MFLAYIDEIGETGAFIAKDHERFNTSPAFGYAGFVIPADSARRFGQKFEHAKRLLFPDELASAKHAGRWEHKGARLFRPDSASTYPHHLRVFAGLVHQVRAMGGSLFYYADEKPIGTPKQTTLDTEARETSAMQETLNRIARHSDQHDSSVMVMIDQINEKTRAARLPRMYGHILGRAASFAEMRRIIEPPMHVDSLLSSNVQFADWVAACVTRAIEFQLLHGSPYGWVTTAKELSALKGAFTLESKLHLASHRSIADFHHSEILRRERPLFPVGSIGSGVPPEAIRKLIVAAQRVHGAS